MASTNRIISHGEGFVENKVSAKVICLKAHERIETGVKNKDVKGEYNGIDYEYSCGTTLRGKTFIKRRILVFKGVIKAFFLIFKDRKKLMQLFCIQQILDI